MCRRTLKEDLIEEEVEDEESHRLRWDVDVSLSLRPFTSKRRGDGVSGVVQL